MRVCVLALGIRHTKRICSLPNCAVSCSLSGAATCRCLTSWRPWFSENAISYEMFALIFSLTCLWNISHNRRLQRYAVTNVHMSSCQLHVFLYICAFWVITQRSVVRNYHCSLYNNPEGLRFHLLRRGSL